MIVVDKGSEIWVLELLKL